MAGLFFVSPQNLPPPNTHNYPTLPQRITNPRTHRYAIARPDLNEHTYAAVFGALSDVGRTDEAISIWEQLSGSNVDVGPVGASAIIKACARVRDVSNGLRIFERMLRRRVTFNRYTYNAVRFEECAGGAGALGELRDWVWNDLPLPLEAHPKP